MENKKKYKSGELHDSTQASQYSDTHQLPHRFLAYRDFSKQVKNLGNINKVLDFGSGTGASTQVLFEKGYEVTGLDKSSDMVFQAKENFPHLNFDNTENLNNFSDFDMVFSSFVLFELSTKEEIVGYLNNASAFLRHEGIFYGITGSENLHLKARDWMCFNVNFQENISPKSGDVVKLGLKELAIEFHDYYWKEKDYKECFDLSDLELLQVHYPVGANEEPYAWKDELTTPPFVIFIAKKPNVA
ncbi:MAG: class I SAM-dependent methyltransferase [Simkaniaceae bacterium]|nr:class I SAM-dependent methyltransferase [Candidatus Sacchlamyda saccharinae]